MFSFVKKFFVKLLPPPYLHVAFDYGQRNKPTILLLHGIAADSNTWAHLLKQIDNSKFRIVAMDLLGCGQSPRPSYIDYNVDDFVKSVRRTVKKAHIKTPFIIMGHSMGALIAARYGRLYPKAVSSEYLLSIPVYYKNEELHTNKSKRQTDLFLKTYEFMLKNKGFTVFTFKIMKHVVKLLNRKMNMDIQERDWQSFSLSLKNTIIHQNVINDLKNTNKKIKIRVIYGSLDELLVQDNIYRLARISNNIEITKISAADHIIGHTFAKEVVDLLYKDNRMY